MTQYAIIRFSGEVLVPDAGTDYDEACAWSQDLGRRIPRGFGVVNLGFILPNGRINEEAPKTQ